MPPALKQVLAAFDIWIYNNGEMDLLLQVAQDAAWRGFAAATDVIWPHSFLPKKHAAMVECHESCEIQKFELEIRKSTAICEKMIAQARSSILVQSLFSLHYPRPAIP